MGDAVAVARTVEAEEWLGAIAQPGVRAGLEAVYARAADAIAARGPVCWASGRCCNFKEAGHRLYVTGLEAAYLVHAMAEEGRDVFGVGRSSSNAAAAQMPPRAVPLPQAGARPIDLARWLSADGPAPDCVFQVGNLCSVHTIKPLACRLYFCDRTAQTWQSETLERLIAEVRELHDRESIGYLYAEWRATLAMFAER